MRHSRLRTLLIGLTAGVAYAFLCMLIVSHYHDSVSVSYIFVLPVLLGAIPVLFSTREQLKAYKIYLLFPWLVTFTFFVLSYVTGFEGMICLIIIMAPFFLLGTLGAFVFMIIRLKSEGKGTKLYAFMFLPFLLLLFEENFRATEQVYNVSTSIEVNAEKLNVWENIKNVKNIKENEIQTHFIHLIGIPKPLHGELDKEGVGGTRYITWEKGIKFREKINSWQEGTGFAYDIDVDPASIPPTTLDEHVMIGGRYFDVLNGSYLISSKGKTKQIVTLNCRYRVTTNLNWYSRLWAEYILNDFNKMILEVIKNRCENQTQKIKE